MRFNDDFGDVKAEIYIGRKAILGAKSKLDELASHQSQDIDSCGSIPAFFADAALWKAYPIAVILRKSTGLYGAALFHARTARGVPLGIVTAGHKCGRGATIAAPADRPRVAEFTARALLRRFVAHTVMIRLPAELADPLPVAIRTATIRGNWQRGDASSRLPLDGGMDGLMARFSYKMRRNLRYYRRRADEELGCVFIPKLTQQQTQHALVELSARSTFPIKIATTLTYTSELAHVKGSFAVGLQDSKGRWVSFLTGYRRTEASYVTLQLNHAEPKATSLMTVMRSYFLEHEIALGSPNVVFVGGVNPGWARSCVPQICHELLAVRTGIQSAAFKTFGTWLRPTGLISEVYGRSLELPSADSSTPELL